MFHVEHFKQSEKIHAGAWEDSRAPFFREVNYVNRYCCGNFDSPRTGRYIGHTHFWEGCSFSG